MTRWSGVIGAPVTPFDPGGRVNHHLARRCVAFLVAQGVDAVALPLHTGESPSLSVSERKALVEVGVDAVGGRVPVMVHASMPGTPEVVDLARHAEASGAAAVVVVTPYHWRPGPASLVAHYRAVCDHVGIDVLAYSFPSRLGVAVTPDLIETLAGSCPNFVGVKDASYDMQSFTECVRRATACREDFSMLTGVEYLLPSMAVGGSGCFSPSSGVAPRLVRRLEQACRAGDVMAARPLQHRASALWHLLRETGYPASVKACMALLDREVGGVRLPLLQLDPPALERLRAGLETLGVLDGEPRGWAD
jgi:dihydrodipicolinate synthase/N-acetylneuraminate lyase